MNYFVLGALVLCAMLTFQVRGTMPMRLPSLPAGVVPADLLLRLAAGIIDLAPWFVLVSVFLPQPASTDEAVRMLRENRAPNIYYYAGMAAIGAYVVYCSLMEFRFGTTGGKAILGLRVTNDQGQRASLQQILLRNVLKVVELLWIWPPYVPILLFMPLLNRNRQRLGDLFARTLVVTGKPVASPPGGQDETAPHDADEDEGRK